jgi:TonB family protein
MTTPLANLLAYSVQFAILAAAAALVVRLVRLRAPLPALRFWQAILALSILLPIAQIAVTPATPSSTLQLFSVVTSSATSAVSDSFDVARWTLYLLISGAAMRVLWLAIGLLRLRAITRRAEPAPALEPMLGELSTAIGGTSTIAFSDDLQTPATVGVRRPLILVPRRLLDLPEAVQRAVIAHELIHVRRRDWMHTVAEECWCALLWFHPAARLIAARLSLARETVVDEATILLTRDRRAYAEALLAFANPQPHLPGVIALIGRRQLSQRISLLAEEEVMTRRRLVLSLVVAFLVAGGATAAAVAAFPLTTPHIQATVYEPGDVSALPVVVYEVKPAYTAEAMQEKIQGSVFMQVVVSETGDVTDVRVTESLDADFGLYEQAVKAAYRWKFKPGMKGDRPVPVRVVLEMTFTLK